MSYEFGMAHLFIFFIICNAHHHLEWGRLETLEPLIVLGKLNHFKKFYMVAHLELSPNIKCKRLLIVTQSLLYIIYTDYKLHV